MEQYYNTGHGQCPIQPVNRICKRNHPLQSNTESYSCVILRESEFHLVKAHPCPKYHLGAVDDDGNNDGDDDDGDDDDDDNDDSDANYHYDQDYEC